MFGIPAKRVVLSLMTAIAVISGITNLIFWVFGHPLFSIAFSPWMILFGLVYLWIQYRLPHMMFHGSREINAIRVNAIRESGICQLSITNSGSIGELRLTGIFQLQIDVYAGGVLIKTLMSPYYAILVNEIIQIDSAPINLKTNSLVIIHDNKDIETPITLINTDIVLIDTIRRVLTSKT